ncbi:MAG: TrkA C-terminal domain-containing protein [Bacteroidales bacterium]
MAGIISVILILVVSILITRVASVALTHTGLSKESSKFQARSAYTGVGFTTNESEKVVNHPVRRKILLILMILGNAGIISGITSLIVGFSDIEDGTDTWVKIAILLGGIIILWNLSSSRWLDRKLSNLISRILKSSKKLDVHDYANLLHLSGEFRISEFAVEPDNWLANKKISTSKLRDEGLNILAVSRNDDTFVGNPVGSTIIKPGDSLIIYGRAEALEKLENRIKGAPGDSEHKEMSKKQNKIVKKEKKEDHKSIK